MSKGQGTKERIITSAAPLFNERGYTGCSMQDIMQATNLEKGGIYRHFESKEDLAAACFEYSWAQTARSRSGDVGNVTHAVEKLRYLVNRFVSLPSPMPGGCPLMNLAIAEDDGNPRLRTLAEGSLRAWKNFLLTIIESGMTRGEIYADTNAQMLANSIIAQLEGSLMISRLEENPKALDDAKQSLETTFKAIST